MFDLSTSWWELVVRGAVVYLALFVLVRVSGKRTVGQFTPFDLLVVMLLSESVSNALSGGDESLPGGLLVAATLIVLNATVGYLSSRNKRLERVLEGHPVLIGRDGKWFEEVLKEHRLGPGDVQKALREADASLREMKLAVLEADGNISIVTK